MAMRTRRTVALRSGDIPVVFLDAEVSRSTRLSRALEDPAARERHLAGYEASLLSAYDHLAAEYGPEHSEAQQNVRMLIDLYERWEKDEQVAQWRAKLMQWRDSTQPATTQHASDQAAE